ARRLKSAKDERRNRLIEALGILGGPSAEAALADQMKSSKVEVRMAAARALGQLGARPDALITGLKDKELPVRWMCAVGLAAVDVDSGRAALVRWVHSAPPKKPVPGYVLRRIGKWGGKVNAEKLGAEVAKVLPKTKQARALLEIAWNGRLKACAPAARKHWKARDPITRALALRVSALEPNSMTPADVKKALNHKASVVRYAAVNALLSAAKDPEKALDHVLRSKREDVLLEGVRFAAAHKRKDAIGVLGELAQGKITGKRAMLARAAACVALGRLGRLETYPILAKLAEERAWQIRAAALEGIIFCWTKEAIPVYLRYYKDHNAIVRKVVRTNLRYMTKKDFDKQGKYEAWWKEFGEKYNLVHPEDAKKKIQRERDKYGYAVAPRKFIQDMLGGTDILAIRGRWDFVEKVLADLKVEHTAVFAQKIKTLGLTPKQIVLVNCEGTTDSDSSEYLRWFVATGGYMATTDWALVNALTRTFPQVIAKYAKRNTGNDVVVVEPFDEKSPMLKGAFPFGVRSKWWLEVQAFPIVIEDPIRAQVLVDSFQMLERYGSSGMLIEFSAGLGKVVHSTSHFFLGEEGFANYGTALERKRFAADHLGLPMAEIRALDKSGFFEQTKETTPISRSYSMFVMLVNFIREKEAIDINLR
ncbi:MAG: HEAT repeat domain-containing protein, partial [Planctomycetota bacterium]